MFNFANKHWQFQSYVNCTCKLFFTCCLRTSFRLLVSYLILDTQWTQLSFNHYATHVLAGIAICLRLTERNKFSWPAYPFVKCEAKRWFYLIVLLKQFERLFTYYMLYNTCASDATGACAWSSHSKASNDWHFSVCSTKTLYTAVVLLIGIKIERISTMSTLSYYNSFYTVSAGVTG